MSYTSMSYTSKADQISESQSNVDQALKDVGQCFEALAELRELKLANAEHRRKALDMMKRYNRLRALYEGELSTHDNLSRLAREQISQSANHKAQPFRKPLSGRVID